MQDPEPVVRGGPPTPSGFYSPINQGRQISMPGGLQTMVGRLVSYHEAMHQFLNQSSAFGCAMILVGSLVEAGEAPFQPLLTSLVEAARETHETLATVASLCIASGGSLNPELLNPFPNYRRFLTTYQAAFGENTRPFLANIALMSCTRAAMQTEICEQLFGEDPPQWPGFELADRDKPDTRLALLLRPDMAATAMDAIDAALANAGEIGQKLRAGMPPGEEQLLLSLMDPAVQDTLSAAAFTVFADALEAAGYPKPDYDAQRPVADWAVKRVNDAFGAQLKSQHIISRGIKDDLEVVSRGFRREVLVFRERPDSALALQCDGSELASPENFILAGADFRYLQLVVMPIGKAKTLYAFEDGTGALDAYGGEVVTALRRRWAFADGRTRVEFLLIRRADLMAFSAAHPEVRILTIISAAASFDTVWRQEWLTPGHGTINRAFVLLDVDPFSFLMERGSRGKVKWARLGLKMQVGADEAVEILCLTAEDQPGILYLAPCTIPFRQAVVDFLERRQLIEALDRHLLEEWDDLLPHVLGHLVREESRFGCDFWC